MQIPRTLAAAWSQEQEWLDALPGLVTECVEMWSLDLEQPIDTPHSLVVPAGQVVLKLNAPSHDEAEHEADALELWDGRSAVQLLARNDERRALLLERCVPGTRLWDAGVDEAAVVAGLLPGLQVAIAGEHPFTLVADEAERWAREVPSRYADAGTPFERHLLEAALDVYRSVDRSATWLVNQDLHGGNVLRSSRGWLVIDPKPLVGEREVEASGLLRNAASAARLLDGPFDLSRAVTRWLDALADVGFDRERSRSWAAAHNLAWGWSERRGWSQEHVAIAQRILRAR